MRRSLPTFGVSDNPGTVQPETYQWLLVPEQRTPQAPTTWEATRLTGGEPALAARASRKLRSDETLLGALGSTILRKHLDDVPLWRGEHVAVRQLVEDFARYAYLPRLRGAEVLVQAIRDGVALLTWSSDTFACAESYDEAAGRYRGLRAGQMVNVAPDSPWLLVRPEVARHQMDVEAAPSRPAPVPERGVFVDVVSAEPAAGADAPLPPPSPVVAPVFKRFHGTVELDGARVGRDAGKIAEEVIAHLAGLVGADVTVTLEIEANVPAGAPEHVVRTVNENSRTLKFTTARFEKE